jgi:hypothetical protein
MRICLSRSTCIALLDVASFSVVVTSPFEAGEYAEELVYEHSNRRNQGERSLPSWSLQEHGRREGGGGGGLGECSASGLLTTEPKARCASQTAGLAVGGFMG